MAEPWVDPALLTHPLCWWTGAGWGHWGTPNFVTFLHIVTWQSGNRTPTLPFWEWNSLKHKQENSKHCASGSGISKRRFYLSDTPAADTSASASAKVCDSPINNWVQKKKAPGWDYKTSISFKMYASVHKPGISARKHLQHNKNGHWLWILAEVQVFLTSEVVSGSSTSWHMRTRFVFWTWSSAFCMMHFFGAWNSWQRMDFRLWSHRGRHQVTTGKNCSLKTTVLKPNAQDIGHYRG